MITPGQNLFNTARKGSALGTGPLPIAASVAAGSFIAVRVALDAVGSATCGDSQGNTYQLDAFAADPPRAEGPGNTLALFSSIVSFPLQTGVDTITIMWDAPSGAWAATADSFLGVSQNLDDGGTSGAAGVAPGAKGPTSLTLNAAPAGSSDLIYVAIAINGPATDVFTSDPSFVLMPGGGTTGGNDLSNHVIQGAFLLPSVPGPYIYNASLSVPRQWVAAIHPHTPS